MTLLCFFLGFFPVFVRFSIFSLPFIFISSCFDTLDSLKAKLASHRQYESDTNKISDSEELLGDGESDQNKYTGAVESEEIDTLLDEIDHSLNEDEKTDNPVSEKLANIANKRWLQKLGDDQFKE